MNLPRGYLLCVEHMNEKDGVLGRKLELLASATSSASSTWTTGVVCWGMDVVLGPFGSPSTEAVADVTEGYEMPMMPPAPGYERRP